MHWPTKSDTSNTIEIYPKEILMILCKNVVDIYIYGILYHWKKWNNLNDQ
jgi:hypothetical protein